MPSLAPMDRFRMRRVMPDMGSVLKNNGGKRNRSDMVRFPRNGITVKERRAR